MYTKMLIVVLAAAIGLGIYGFATLDNRGDEDQIRSTIDEAVIAVNNRDISGTISPISRNYKDESEWTYDRLRYFLAQALQNETKYKLNVEIKNVQVDGKTATVDIHATVTNLNSGGTSYSRDLSMTWQKEKVRRALIVPTGCWRVIRMEGLGFADLEQRFSG